MTTWSSTAATIISRTLTSHLLLLTLSVMDQSPILDWCQVCMKRNSNKQATQEIAPNATLSACPRDDSEARKKPLPGADCPPRGPHTESQRPDSPPHNPGRLPHPGRPPVGSQPTKRPRSKSPPRRSHTESQPAKQPRLNPRVSTILALALQPQPGPPHLARLQIQSRRGCALGSSTLRSTKDQVGTDVYCS